MSMATLSYCIAEDLNRPHAWLCEVLTASYGAICRLCSFSIDIVQMLKKRGATSPAKALLLAFLGAMKENYLAALLNNNTVVLSLSFPSYLRSARLFYISLEFPSPLLERRTLNVLTDCILAQSS